ncbi:unnamed protein product [Mytilus coruscus]|uniref:Reverse transcriptase domain-containing protein n=1 Tax=Mytilus coruscus TaxID=42192 RepID=A0A6J8BX57_MYTCO|nr:unnamed protein product [Mytilus coruscus]
MFEIEQGVRQGGTISADLYKLYVNPLLNVLCETGLGGNIGDIRCCAQIKREGYTLQPTKSVVLPISTSTKSIEIEEDSWNFSNNPMSVVEHSTHIGIQKCQKNSTKLTFAENMKKARSLYSLMGTGLHGKSGLDPETAITILNTYVIPILTYGLEILLPTGRILDSIYQFHKQTIKQILSLAKNTADPAVYILSGSLPIEAELHLKALSLFGKITRADKSTIEWRLAERQLQLKTNQNNCVTLYHISESSRYYYIGKMADLGEKNKDLLETLEAMHVEPKANNPEEFTTARKRTKRIVLYNVIADKPYELVSSAVRTYAKQKDVHVTFTKLLKRRDRREVKSNCSYEVSDHYPVFVQMNIDLPSRKSNAYNINKKTLKWSKADDFELKMYQTENDKLLNFETNSDNVTEGGVERFSSLLINALHMVKNSCIPIGTFRPYLKPYWKNQNLNNCHFEQRNARRKWINNNRTRQKKMISAMLNIKIKNENFISENESLKSFCKRNNSKT